MNAKFTFSPNTNLCQVSLSSKDVFERLRFNFSMPNEAKKFIHGPNAWRIPDRIYFITPTGKFLFGLAETILDWMRKNIHDLTVDYELSDDFKKRLTKDTEEHEIKDDLAFHLRDYQKEAVKLALHHQYGTFVMGTGAGKTLTIASIINNLYALGKIKKTLILVPDNGLVLQFEDELKNQYRLDKKISLFYDKHNKIDEEADITIANRPLFLSRFKQNEKFFRETIDCLIVDEAHSIKHSNKVSEAIKKMRAWYRFGFTGTLAEERQDKMKNLGMLGPVRYQKTSKELRDAGFLSDVTIHSIRLNYLQTFAMDGYRDEIEFLQLYEPRNMFLRDLAFKLPNNTLILVNFLAHGFALEEMFNQRNEKLPEGKRKQVYFIRGEVENEVREEVKKIMESDSNVICIAITKIFSTGINIKNIHHVVLAAGGKSSVTVVQSIGRGLRLHPNKKELRIWDISDNGYKYSTNHLKKRLEIYETEKIRVESHDFFLKH